ncbi:MAG: hypothetical protein WBF06_14555 [Candidatus Acidiferrales bacterium]
MRELKTTLDIQEIVIEVGGLPVRLRAANSAFLRSLEKRYAGFVSRTEHAEFEFDIDLTPPGPIGSDDDLHVLQRAGRWSAVRGDFRAEWNPISNRGSIRHFASPYSVDAVLRIVHTLALSRRGGFLVHAASAVRNGAAFLFAGASGAGKTTLARLAPENAVLLSDEISYVRKREVGYFAFGTPFTGELAKVGENICAPIAALYILAKGLQNRVEPVAQAEAGRALLTNILFFAEDAELVRLVFESACEFVVRVPVYRLTFVPDASVWEFIA